MPQPSPKILIAALDWGLGHAARCIPIIRALQADGADVYLAGNGRALALLRQEFPQLPFFELPAYNIRYHKSSMVWSIGFQMFKILFAIAKEHFALRQLVRRHDIKIVLSDCRFGCFTRRAGCIFITHQLHIRTPYAWLSSLVNFGHRLLLQRYHEIWIPDVEEASGLAGALSHPPLPKSRYIGLLSRMQRLDRPVQYDVVVVLSGPEPQRTLLETKILAQAMPLNIKLLLIQGKPEEIHQYSPRAGLDVCSTLSTEALNEAMCAAKVILARSGYSTLMDLARMGKPAILIPTPGQTEQEYLAAYWAGKGAFFVCEQENFDLKKALEVAEKLPGLDPNIFSTDQFLEALANIQR